MKKADDLELFQLERSLEFILSVSGRHFEEWKTLLSNSMGNRGVKYDQREHIINLKRNYGDQHSAKEPMHDSDIRH